MCSLITMCIHIKAYKFSWFPKGVLVAGMSSATYRLDGTEIQTDPGKLFSYAEGDSKMFPTLNLESVFMFQYTYITAYGIVYVTYIYIYYINQIEIKLSSLFVWNQNTRTAIRFNMRAFMVLMGQNQLCVELFGTR
jgi:hypothetical protein